MTPGSVFTKGMTPVERKDYEDPFGVRRFKDNGQPLPGQEAFVGDGGFDVSAGPVTPKTAPLVKLQLEQKEAEAANRSKMNSVQSTIDLTDSILKDPALDSVLGAVEGRMPEAWMGEERMRVQSKINQLKGQAYMQGREALKGGGQITEQEANKAEQALIRAEQAVGEKDFRLAMEEFKTHMRAAMEAYQRETGQGAVSSMRKKYGLD